MNTVSEEQVLFNKLSYEEQQFILKQMRMLQPCELSCEREEKKIPEKFDNYEINSELYTSIKCEQLRQYFEMLCESYNQLLDYLKSKGE